MEGHVSKIKDRWNKRIKILEKHLLNSERGSFHGSGKDSRQLSLLKDMVGYKSEDMEAFKQKIRELESELVSLREDLLASRCAVKIKGEELEKQRFMMSQDFESLEKKVISSQKEKDELLKRFDAAKKEKEAFTEQAKRINSELILQQKNNEQSTILLNQYRETIVKKDEEISKLVLSVEQYRKNNRFLKEEIVKLKIESMSKKGENQ